MKSEENRPVAEKAQDAAQQAAKQAVAPRPTRRYRALVFQGYIVAAVIAFAVLAFVARTTVYFPVDLTITRFLQAYHAAWFDTLMRLLSIPGYTPQAFIIVGLVIVLLYLAGLRWESAVSIFAILGVEILDLVVKLVVHRPRPGADLVNVVVHLNDYSFPSGHVTTYTAFYGFLLFLAFTLLKPAWWRTLLMIFLAALIVLIGPSRIYLGEHWASDVFGAYLLGSVWLALSVYVYRWGKSRFFVRQPVAPEQPGRQRVES